MNINKWFTPTPEEVVEIQLSAVMDEFNFKENLEDSGNDADEITTINAAIDEVKEIHETPVNLGECRIVNKMALIRLTKECLDDKPHWIDDKDIRYNVFYLWGEVSQAPGHICVMAQSGKMYLMQHTENFEIIPTQEC